MISQEQIAAESVLLWSVAMVQGDGKLEIRVSNREEGALLCPVSLDGKPVTWNHLPDDMEEVVFGENEMTVNTRIVCVCPWYITLILPNGDVVRGMDVGKDDSEAECHELWDLLVSAIETHYIASINEKVQAANAMALESLNREMNRQRVGFSVN